MGKNDREYSQEGNNPPISWRIYDTPRSKKNRTHREQVIKTIESDFFPFTLKCIKNV